MGAKKTKPVQPAAGRDSTLNSEGDGPENHIKTTGVESQAMFRAMFGYDPKVDTRTPDDVKEQKKAEGWK